MPMFLYARALPVVSSRPMFCRIWAGPLELGHRLGLAISWTRVNCDPLLTSSKVLPFSKAPFNFPLRFFFFEFSISNCGIGTRILRGKVKGC